MFPPSPFWDFSLRLYARSGVAGACLCLQDRHGIDVNVLFCCLWLGMEGERATRRDIARMMARVRSLHEQVVKPLRTARTALKSMLPAGAEELLPAMGALRSAIKKSELDAEHLEQIVLGAMRPRRAKSGSRAGAALAETNAMAYLTVAGARLGSTDRADLAAIVAALAPAETAKLDGAGSPLPVRLGRRRPLARAGGGA
jgi:uncharacterized protein (TIGR02444 family)